MEKITKRSATYSIPVESILLFKLEFRFNKDTVPPMCVGPFTGFIETTGSRSQAVGFFVLGLHFGQMREASMFLLFLPSFVFPAFEKFINFSSFFLISVAILYFSAFSGFLHIFSVHVLPPLFSCVLTLVHDLLPVSSPTNPSQRSQFPGFFHNSQNRLVTQPHYL